MLKKILSIILVIVMVCSLVACDKNPQDNEETAPHNNTNAEDTILKEMRLKQEDEDAIEELRSALVLSMADQDVYDELMMHVFEGNVSSYIEPSKDPWEYVDIIKEETNTSQRQYRFGCETRHREGIIYHVAGNMRGVTITFQPETLNDGSVGMCLKNGIINKFIRNDNATYINYETIQIAKDRSNIVTKHIFDENPDYSKHGLLSTMNLYHNDKAYCYNRVKATIEKEEIVLRSQAYSSSEYTLFICMDGALIEVDGQWNGTYLK